MEKKILAVYSNELFFGKDTPNFYQWLADERGIGSDVNNPPPFLSHHRSARFLDAHESSAQADGKHFVPELVTHEWERCVAEDSSVVDEDID